MEIMEERRTVIIDWSECPAVDRDPGRVGGAWCFRDSRLPVSFLFDNLEQGATIDEFLEWFPGITRDQVTEVLEFAKRTLEQPVAHA
jgi:uncharacterized protein (DUF433 family)